MLKRLDWLDVHGEQGGDSSSSDDSDSPSDASSDEQSSGPDQEDAVAGSKRQHAAARPSANPSGHVTWPANRATAAAGKALSPSKRPTAEVAQQHKKLKRAAVDGTAANHVEPAGSIDPEESPHVSARQDTSSDREQQQQKKQLKQRQKAQHPDNQQQQMASKQHLSRAQQRQLEASSDSDTGSYDADIAEYRREMMLGRVLSSSDDDGGDGSASDAEGADSGSEGSEGQPELQVQEVERNWAESDLSEALRGVALRCVPCRSLLLNAQSYRTHIHSKKHLSAMQKWDHDEDEHFIAFATDAPGKQSAADEGETHAERLERLKQQIAAENAGLAAQQKQGSNNSKGNKSQISQQQRRK